MSKTYKFKLEFTEAELAHLLFENADKFTRPILSTDLATIMEDMLSLLEALQQKRFDHQLTGENHDTRTGFELCHADA